VHKWRCRVEVGRLRSRGPRRGGIHAARELCMATALVAVKSNTNGNVQYKDWKCNSNKGSHGPMAAPDCP
jgi:hypothetical protein